MKFCKYHGAGNDFVLIDNRAGEIPEDKKASLAKRVCDRSGEIGADGLLLVETSDVADAKMRIFNPDGSEPAMCGNGIRCVAKHVHDKGITKDEIAIETLAGIKTVRMSKENDITYVRVNMGKPLLERRDIPATGEGRLFEENIEAAGKELKIYAVNTGVPHVVIFVSDIRLAEVKNVGRAVRNHPLFPKGTNVNFVEIVCANLFKIRTYERGVEDETLACGTGITAAGVICVMIGEANSEDSIEIVAEGGTVYVEVDLKGTEIETAYMKGPAEFVSEGEIDV
ncbi:diaminopimelate epimerase [archaeon]|nr:diaminopimelate epimerase [archaeon]